MEDFENSGRIDEDCLLALLVLSANMDVMDASTTFRMGSQAERAGRFLWLVMAGGDPLRNSPWGGTSDGHN